MKNIIRYKFQVLVGIGLLILTFFMYRSYSMIEKDIEKYPSSEKEKPSTSISHFKSEIVSNESKGSATTVAEEYKGNKLVFQRFQSDNYDIETTSGVYETINKSSIHSFDFVKKSITLEIEGKAPQKYSFLNSEQTQRGYTDFNNVNSDVSQIWFSSNSIGYKYKSGKKLVFYGLSRISD